MRTTRSEAADLVFATACEKLPDLLIKKMNEAYAAGLEAAERCVTAKATRLEHAGDIKTMYSKALWGLLEELKTLSRGVYGGDR